MAAVTVASTSRGWAEVSTSVYWNARSAFYKTSSNAIYVVTQDTGASPKVRVRKSSGAVPLSFSEMDSANAKTISSVNLPFSAWFDGTNIHIVAFTATNTLTHFRFSTSTDTWTTANGNISTAVQSERPVRVVTRSDGDILVFFTSSADDADLGWARWEGASWTVAATGILASNSTEASHIVEAEISSGDIAAVTFYDCQADDYLYTTVNGSNTVATAVAIDATVGVDETAYGMGNYEPYTESGTIKMVAAFLDNDQTIDEAVISFNTAAASGNISSITSIETTATNTGARTPVLTASTDSGTTAYALWWDDASSGTLYYSLKSSGSWAARTSWKTAVSRPIQFLQVGTGLLVIYQSDATTIAADWLVNPSGTRALASMTAAIKTSPNRPVLETAAIRVNGLKRVVTETVAIKTTLNRSVSASLSLIFSGKRVVSATAAIQQVTTSSRAVASTAAISAITPAVVSTTHTASDFPAQYGPFVANSALWAVLHNKTTNKLGVFKSTNNGTSWSEVDSANAPSTGTAASHRSYHAVLLSTTIYVAYLQASDVIALVKFDTTTALWGTPSTGGPTAFQKISAGGFGVHLTVRSNGDAFIMHQGAVENVGGTNYRRVVYSKYSGTTWTSNNALSATGVATNYDMGTLVADSSDRIHFVWMNASTSSLPISSTLTAADVLGSPANIASNNVSVATGSYMTLIARTISGTEQLLLQYGGSSSNAVSAVYATAADTPTWTGVTSQTLGTVQSLSVEAIGRQRVLITAEGLNGGAYLSLARDYNITPDAVHNVGAHFSYTFGGGAGLVGNASTAATLEYWWTELYGLATDSIQVYGLRTGNPTDNLLVQILDGEDLTNVLSDATIAGMSIPTNSSAFFSLTLSQRFRPEIGKTYVIRFSRTGSISPAHYYSITANSSSSASQGDANNNAKEIFRNSSGAIQSTNVNKVPVVKMVPWTSIVRVSAAAVAAPTLGVLYTDSTTTYYHQFDVLLRRTIDPTAAIKTTQSRAIATTVAIGLIRRITNVTASISAPRTIPFTAPIRTPSLTRVVVTASAAIADKRITQRTAVVDNKTTASTSHDVTKPTGLSDGDVLYAFLAPLTATITAVPSGWSLVQTLNATSSASSTIHVYRKVVSSAASEPATWTWTLGSSVTSVSICQAFVGVNNTTPEDTSFSNNGSTAGPNVPPGMDTGSGVAVVTDNALLMFVSCAITTTGTTSPPSNMLEVAEGGTGVRDIELATQYLLAGDSGIRYALTSTSAQWNAGIIALKPAVGTWQRAIPATAAIKQTSKRSVSATVSLSANVVTSSRAVPATASVTLRFSRSVSETVAIKTTQSRAVPVTVAVKTTLSRSVSNTAVIKTTLTRTVPKTVAIKTILSRAVLETAAIKTTSFRGILESAAIKQTNTRPVPFTVSVKTVNVRTVSTTATISVSFKRVVSETAAIRTTLSRSVSNTAVITTTLSRSVSTTVAIAPWTLKRTVPETAAIRTSPSRAVPTTAAIRTTLSRAVSETVAIKTTLIRSVSFTAAIKTIEKRSVPFTASILTTRKQVVPETTSVLVASKRNIPFTVAVRVTSARAVITTAAIRATQSRVVPMSASIGVTGIDFRIVAASIAVSVSAIKRAVPTTVAIAPWTLSRAIPTSTIIRTINTRSVSETAAIRTTSVRVILTSTTIFFRLTRSIVFTAAIKTIPKRVVPASVSISGPTNIVIPVTTAVRTTEKRVVLTTAAIRLTLNRTVPASAALSLSYTRVVPVTASIQAAGKRSIPTSASTMTTVVRTLPNSAALSITAFRSVNASAALVVPQKRIVPATVAIHRDTPPSAEPDAIKRVLIEIEQRKWFIRYEDTSLNNIDLGKWFVRQPDHVLYRIEQLRFFIRREL